MDKQGSGVEPLVEYNNRASLQYYPHPMGFDRKIGGCKIFEVVPFDVDDSAQE